jgi:glutamine synthetase
MYFALSALLAAGILGLAANEAVSAYPERDVAVNPATLDEHARAELGITQKLPKSLSEAMDALHRDTALNEALAPTLVRDYLSMKESERQMLGGMSEYERKMFLIERY